MRWPIILLFSYFAVSIQEKNTNKLIRFGYYLIEVMIPLVSNGIKLSLFYKVTKIGSVKKHDQVSSGVIPSIHSIIRWSWPSPPFPSARIRWHCFFIYFYFASLTFLKFLGNNKLPNVVYQQGLKNRLCHENWIYWKFSLK